MQAHSEKFKIFWENDMACGMWCVCVCVEFSLPEIKGIYVFFCKRRRRKIKSKYFRMMELTDKCQTGTAQLSATTSTLYILSLPFLSTRLYPVPWSGNHIACHSFVSWKGQRKMWMQCVHVVSKRECHSRCGRDAALLWMCMWNVSAARWLNWLRRISFFRTTAI